MPSASKIAATRASSQTTLQLAAVPAVEEPRSIAGDPASVKDITQFYQTWIVKRNVVQASRFASQRSYQCLAAPSDDQKKLTPIARIQSALQQPLTRIPAGANLSDMMSSMQPVDDLLRPVQQENSKAFAIMAVPDQMADSFLCQHRNLPESSPDLKPADAKYGAYYLTASRFNYGEEQSPALLLLVDQRGSGLEDCRLGCRASVTRAWTSRIPGNNDDESCPRLQIIASLRRTIEDEARIKPFPPDFSVAHRQFLRTAPLQSPAMRDKEGQKYSEMAPKSNAERNLRLSPLLRGIWRDTLSANN